MFRIHHHSAHRTHRHAQPQPQQRQPDVSVKPQWARFDLSTFEPARGSAPQAPAPLTPTPLAKEVPGQIETVHCTPQHQQPGKSKLLSAVNQAIDTVRANHIGIDPNDPDRITDFNAYHSAVVTELLRAGYYAAHDGEELAVGIKGASFSEQFDISTWDGKVRRFFASQLTPPVFEPGAA